MTEQIGVKQNDAMDMLEGMVGVIASDLSLAVVSEKRCSLPAVLSCVVLCCAVLCCAVLWLWLCCAVVLCVV